MPSTPLTTSSSQPEATSTPQAPRGQSRKTAQRTTITSALDKTTRFVSAQELHDTISHSGARIGLATVYRTLQSLAASGEIDSVRHGNETLYRRCRTGAHHHHLICRSCGKAVEIEGEQAEKWAQAVAAQAGFTELDHTIELTGLCAECSQRRERPQSSEDAPSQEKQ